MEKPNSTDPFLLRAIEHWLDSLNELSYQPFFCFWLTTKGYAVKYSIKNTHFEQGKDVVAVDKKGIAHAYQLKGGDINLIRWRTEVLPEIEELIDIPIKHPEINSSKNHVSYLVTNGNIEDNVRVLIDDYNSKKWKKTPLHILTRGDLLSEFQDIASGVLPSNANSYKQLLDFLFDEGLGLPNIDQVSTFLYEILDIEAVKPNKQKNKRDISAAMLYANMMVGNYRKKENHAAVVQVMTVLAASILYLVEKFELEDKYWRDSFEIVLNDIITTAKRLDEEIKSKEIVEQVNSPFENELIEFRKNASISIVVPLKLSEYITNDKNWETLLNPEIINRYQGLNCLWSETSFVNKIILAIIFKSHPDCVELSVPFLEDAITNIIQLNGRNAPKNGVLATPYYKFADIVPRVLGLNFEPFNESFKERSYFLGVLIDCLVRLESKTYLFDNWKEITFIGLEEFVPDNKLDYLLWKVKKGTNKTTLMPHQRKWSDLVLDSKSFKGESIPNIIKRFPEFISFFLSVYPHRLNRDIVGYLYYIK